MSWYNHQNLLFYLSAITVAIIPWYASGKSAFAILGLEVIAGIQLLIIGLTHTNRRNYQLGWATGLVIFLFVVLTAMYLTPIPKDIWLSLPGRESYLPAIEWAMQQNLLSATRISLLPYHTVSSFILLIALIALFVSVAMQSIKNQESLIYLIIFIAAIQGSIGAIQYTTGTDPVNFHTALRKVSSASGTYLNRDHFVQLIYITIPLVVALIISLLKGDDERPHTMQFTAVSSITLILVLIIVVLAALFSGSRAGISLAVLGLILSMLIFSRYAGGWHKAGFLLSTIIIAIGVALSIGIISVLNRFLAINPLEDARWEMFENVIIGIKQFFPVGTGPGSFQNIYTTLQPVTQLGFINHAHNDYLELFFEMGLVGMLFVLMLVITYLINWFVLRRIEWGRYKFIKVATGISLLLVALHGLVDFNLHTPANQVFFVVMLAVFLSRSSQSTKTR